jgi:hypothetical protein
MGKDSLQDALAGLAAFEKTCPLHRKNFIRVEVSDGAMKVLLIFE